MKNATIRLLLLISGLYRTVAPAVRRDDSRELPECERGKKGCRTGEIRSGEVWMQSWTVGPF